MEFNIGDKVRHTSIPFLGIGEVTASHETSTSWVVVAWENSSNHCTCKWSSDNEKVHHVRSLELVTQPLKVNLWVWVGEDPDKVYFSPFSPPPRDEYDEYNYGYSGYWAAMDVADEVDVYTFLKIFPELRAPEPKELFEITEEGVTVWEWTP